MRRKSSAKLSFAGVDASWQPCLTTALEQLPPNYITALTQNKDWLPGLNKIFHAFSLPISSVNYVLFGESPYPRAHSANGYAFWDAAVTDIWSATGLSKPVNRATSLRNLIKMLLVAEGLLKPHDLSQPAIAAIDKHRLVTTSNELFGNFLQRGFLLLNASLVLSELAVRKDALAWRPFLRYVLAYLLQERPNVRFLLFGKIANEIDPQLLNHADKLYAEHPYNYSFINNPEILAFFKPLHLLIKP